jgi:Tol biopolymer transport system component
MQNERWQRIEHLFHAALDRAPGERAAFLADECAGDQALRREVESLLASHEQEDHSLDAADIAANLLEHDQAGGAVGRTIDHYKILNLLGAGGMGAIFLAQDQRLARQVALKLLLPEFTRDRDRLRRFEDEARAASALNHPNIITVYDIGSAGDVHFIAMELVDGITLRQKLAGGRVKLGEALDIAAQIASALSAAHAAGIVHRDIKPENILLRRDGYVKIVDFGLAKLTASPAHSAGATRAATWFQTAAGIIMGTPHYMSPEQVRGAAPDSRTDIFSFGAVLYEILTGRRAFQAATAVEAMNAIMNEEPPDLPVEIPGPLQRVVRRCLEKQPEKRFQSADDLAFTLRALTADSGFARPLARPARLHMPGWWFAAAAILLLLAAGTVFLRQAESSWTNPLENAQFNRLTDFEGAEVNAAISADGKFVVFLSGREGTFDAWVTQVGTGQFTNLTRGRFSGLANENVRNVGFSADASRVWFRAADGKGGSEVWVVPTMGGTPRLFLPRGTHAEWSPDGTKLLYAEAGEGDPTFVANSDGTNPKRIFVARTGYHTHFPTWSPAGQYIYFVSGVHVTRQMDIWRIPAAGGDPKRITNQRNWVVSPTPLDDRTLLYSAPADDGSGPWLYAVNVERGRPHRISLGIEQYTSISATADGQRLVATVMNSSAGLWRIPILDHPAQESDALQIELPNVRALGPRYGPDYFLYLSSRGGPEGLWKFKSGEAFELWRGSGNGKISSPAISLDGRQVAFTLRKQGRGTLYVMTAEGTAARTLGESLDVSGVPSWAADGKWIAVIAETADGPRLFKVPANGGSPVQLSEELAWNPIWSPDGRVIVYSGSQVRSRAPLKAVSPEGNPIQFREPIWILPMHERYRFLPDAKGLVIMRGEWRTHQFFLLDLETFRERLLSNLKPGFSMRSFDISPNGKHIVFDRIRDNSDIVVIDLKR